MNTITIIPRLSEKAYLSAQNGCYVFTVPMTANKQQITDAVNNTYSVSAVDVRTVIAKGKSVRFAKGRRQAPGHAYRKDVKKAYIRLAEGQSIPIFEKMEETK